MNHLLVFNEREVLHELKHFLPAQAPLKDFIHHNTLHAFQNLKFYDGIRNASKIFGYKVSLSLEEFREHYKSGRIRKDILEKVITDRKGKKQLEFWKETVLHKDFDTSIASKIGGLRARWKSRFDTDLDSLVHPLLFRILCSYLDQGISIWDFPVLEKGFLASIRELERTSFVSFFKTKRAKEFLINDTWDIEALLKIVVGDESLYKQYLFDQQFAHQGWAGMVSSIEDQPVTLLNPKKITLRELIIFELLLEIDALDYKFGEIWAPLGAGIDIEHSDILAFVPETELSETLSILQDAFEWSYYDQVLAGMKMQAQSQAPVNKSFQAMFCIDDRECSLRRYLEQTDPFCETFGTPGFFGVEFYYQPEHGKFYTKVCPAPLNPKFLIKEVNAASKREKELVYAKYTHSLLRGWLISQTLGYWSAFKLFLNIFKPSMSPATANSFKHMDMFCGLTIENKNSADVENGLQIGFTIEEMASRIEGLLKSIGLVKDFAPLVYVVGHGSSSVNNPHYAAYDCGACSGRPGSVNARAASYMANHPEVRAILKTRGIDIPAEVQFIGGLHDTCRDEIAFYDENKLSEKNKERHQKNKLIFEKALDLNAKERSRRFDSIDSKLDPKKIHKKIFTRSVSLFEPRPELNHATNALCIVGRREISRSLFLDRRAFLNSYDYKVDPEGKYLLNILKAAAPVCGGINLEYFFSRVDNQKLGAGTKLPHNVMGLFGVANGNDGDLRPGLPSQMIEVHDPVRILFVVEHFPDIILNTVKSNEATYEWFINEWVHLIAVHPETKKFFRFSGDKFIEYTPLLAEVQKVSDLNQILRPSMENSPVCLIN